MFTTWLFTFHLSLPVSSPFLLASPKCLDYLFLLTLSSLKSCLYLLPSYWPFCFILKQSQQYIVTQCTNIPQHLPFWVLGLNKDHRTWLCFCCLRMFSWCVSVIRGLFCLYVGIMVPANESCIAYLGVSWGTFLKNLFLAECGTHDVVLVG